MITASGIVTKPIMFTILVVSVATVITASGIVTQRVRLSCRSFQVATAITASGIVTDSHSIIPPDF